MRGRGGRRRRPFRWMAALLVLGAVGAMSAPPDTAPSAAQPREAGTLPIRITWGHRSPASRDFHVELAAQSPELELRDAAGWGLEEGEGPRGGAWRTRAGGGDVDGVSLTLAYPARPPAARRQEQSIWTYLLRHGDEDTARRLRQDPAFLIDPLLLTVRLNPEGTRGFSVSLDQLLEHRALWVPELDVFLSAGEPPVSFEEHLEALRPFGGRRVLDRVRRGPEATYDQFTASWPDMGDPRNDHPSHVVCLTWDSALPKFGVDRLGGVSSDLGSPDQLRFTVDLEADAWRSQRLEDGLPVITTTFEKDGLRYELEQLAYPLDGPPRERRGDIAMVLLQRLRVTNTTPTERTVTLGLIHSREYPAGQTVGFTVGRSRRTRWVEDTPGGGTLFTVEGADGELTLGPAAAAADEERSVARWEARAAVPLTLPAGKTRELVVKLPSPPAAGEDRGKLLRLRYAAARSAALRFWSDYVARGAQFRVPEKVVNDLFRASLWHALRLPRRHGGEEPNVRIDLPYSNFAYGQEGAPWPVIQAVYVDTMLYDLRGYHRESLEELLSIYRSNQEPDGRVGGFANWGVYTPSMIYASAQHYLLSRDREALERLLPPTLKALDWCLEQVRRSRERGGPAAGLMLAPLNDLSHEERAWAFNQAYLPAALRLLGRALEEIGHPRAEECRSEAEAIARSVSEAFARASVLSPLVQLRDHTWIPYVPSDALTSRRLLEVWYPTDVDTGALHLSRLEALDPKGDLTTFLLHDHEDNLFLGGLGMANEPVYNQQAAAYLLRDEPEAVVRAFYSYLACAFSHSVLEPVEHRWGWGQFYGPPSTDGAWFELFRRMLIHEHADGTLRLFQAVPRKWLEDGKRIEVRRAPTYHGRVSLTARNDAASDRITATVTFHDEGRPAALLVRLRHPDGKRIRSARVNGREWAEIEADGESIRIPAPSARRYSIAAHYDGPALGSERRAVER